MEIQIRLLEKSDAEQYVRIGDYAFQSECTQEQLIAFSKQFDPQGYWGCFINGKLAAKLDLLPLQVWLNGRIYDAGGVAGIATWPEHRRLGLVKRLMDHSLKLMREQGQTLSLLHPFNFAFYRKYGWEMFQEQKKYEITVSQLPPRTNCVGTVVRSNDAALFKPIYEAFARKYNGLIARDELWWNNRILGSGKFMACYCSPTGVPEGYLQYRVKDNVMSISEFIALTEQARLGLWNYISNHDSMIRMVTMIAPIDDSLPYLLVNPDIKQQIVPHAMARIVDLIPFMQQYRFQSVGNPFSFTLKVNDPAAQWNDGTFSVNLDADGSASINAYETGDEPDITCSIGTLTTMLFGYRRPLFLHHIEQLSGNAEVISQLERIVPARTTFLSDIF